MVCTVVARAKSLAQGGALGKVFATAAGDELTKVNNYISQIFHKYIFELVCKVILK